MTRPIKEVVEKAGTTAANGNEDRSMPSLSDENTSSRYGDWISVQRVRRRPSKIAGGNTGNQPKETVTSVKGKDRGGSSTKPVGDAAVAQVDSHVRQPGVGSGSRSGMLRGRKVWRDRRGLDTLS